jgi:hypothetical protein
MILELSPLQNNTLSREDHRPMKHYITVKLDAFRRIYLDSGTARLRGGQLHICRFYRYSGQLLFSAKKYIVFNNMKLRQMNVSYM